jgi:TRAP-type C4-dicarboxylate transport system substrate-binding protein
MKRLFVGFLLLLLAVVLTFAGCASQAPATTSVPAATSKAATASAPAAAVITLKWTTHVPNAPSVDSDVQKFILSEAEKRTNGRIKGEIYWASALGKVTDFVKMISAPEGVANAGMVVHAYVPWDMPLINGASMPFLTQGVETFPRAISKLYDDWEPMRQEWDKNNLVRLSSVSSYPYVLFSKQNLAGLKGQRTTAGELWAPIMKYIGTTNVAMASPEIYEGLQKGTIDAAMLPIQLGKTMKFAELCKYIIDFGFAGGQSSVSFAVNKDTWNKMSKDDQATMMAIAADATNLWNTGIKNDLVALNKYYTDQSVQVLSLSNDEQKNIRDSSAQGIWDNWIAQCKQKNVPGDEFIKRYKDIVSQVSK